MILGCDAAGVDEDGNEVVVHAVIGDPAAAAATRPSTRSARCSPRCTTGTFAEQVAVPRRNLVPKPAALSFERGRLPAHGLADGLPHALHQRGQLRARRDRAGAGRRRRRRHRARSRSAGGRAPGLGHQPRRGQARAGAASSAPTRRSSPARGCPSGSTP